MGEKLKQLLPKFDLWVSSCDTQDLKGEVLVLKALGLMGIELEF